MDQTTDRTGPDRSGPMIGPGALTVPPGFWHAVRSDRSTSDRSGVDQTSADRQIGPADRSDRTARTGPDRATGTGPFYAAWLMSLLVSANTSWLFFGRVLHIDVTWERAAIFAVVEVSYIAAGWAMRANIRAHGRPGTARLIAWALTGASAYMAWAVCDVTEATGRILLGPLLGLVLLHAALGIELRRRRRTDGAWDRVRDELRERALSRLGLATDDRPAAVRTADRAGVRVARLALAPRWIPFRRARLARALRASDIAADRVRRTKMLGHIAAVQHADALAKLDLPAPWSDQADAWTVEQAARRAFDRGAQRTIGRMTERSDQTARQTADRTDQATGPNRSDQTTDQTTEPVRLLRPAADQSAANRTGSPQAVRDARTIADRWPDGPPGTNAVMRALGWTSKSKASAALRAYRQLTQEDAS